MVYRSSFVGTFLIVRYAAKVVIFQSESVSTLSIVKDIVSQQASARNIHINIQFETNENSVRSVLKLLKTKFEYYLSIFKKHQVLTALKEISNQVNLKELMNG